MIKTVCILIVLVYLALKIHKIDQIDYTHPFGTDMVKNKKYFKKYISKKCPIEEYGVGIYWGKSNKNDTRKSRLDKIQWLSHKCDTDVLWRRSFIIAVIGTCIISVSNFYNIILIFLILFMSAYFSVNYYRHHVLDKRSKIIDKHIKNLKDDLEISQDNDIINK